MTNSTAFPPSTGTVRRRSTTSNPGKTYGLYINHVRKAAILVGHDDDWVTPAVRLISKGLRNAQDRSFAFPNFIMTPDVMRIILGLCWQSNMGMVAYLSYLFSLRVPSETLQLTITSPGEKLLKFGPHGPKALIGPRTYHDATALVIEFRHRENVRGGRIIIRPCLCTVVSPPNRTFCPARGFCATNRCRLIIPGNPPVPNTSANNFNQRLKRAMRDLNYDGGHRYSSHAFRRGGRRRS